METIIIIFGVLISILLFKINNKIEKFNDNFESWYSDWQNRNPIEIEEY